MKGRRKMVGWDGTGGLCLLTVLKYEFGIVWHDMDFLAIRVAVIFSLLVSMGRDGVMAYFMPLVAEASLIP